MLSKALKIATASLYNEEDVAGQPYLKHLIAVSEKVAVQTNDPDLEVVAMLRDVLELSPDWDEHLLRFFFTEEIVNCVVALTKKPGQTYHEYIEQVCKNTGAMLVKKAVLEEYLDLTRLEHLSSVDYHRITIYHKAYRRILSELVMRNPTLTL